MLYSFDEFKLWSKHGIGDKEYLKEHYIEEMLDQFQANISMASFYGITANDIMNYYNTKFLEKLKHRPRVKED